MGNESTDQAVSPWQIVRDMLRALFVVGQGLLAMLLVAYTVIGFGMASNPTSPAVDTVVLAIGSDDVAVFAMAATVALVGSAFSVRLWLRGSWHVVTVAVGTAFGMLLFFWALALRNWQY